MPIWPRPIADLNDWSNASQSIQSAIDIDPNRVDVQRALGYVREVRAITAEPPKPTRKPSSCRPI